MNIYGQIPLPYEQLVFHENTMAKCDYERYVYQSTGFRNKPTSSHEGNFRKGEKVHQVNKQGHKRNGHYIMVREHNHCLKLPTKR